MSFKGDQYIPSSLFDANIATVHIQLIHFSDFLSFVDKYFYMKYSGKIFPLDEHIITAVRKRRMELGMSQEEVSLELEVNSAFVSLVETPSRREKYNIHHLNKLAEILKCSISDFLPEPYLENNK